MVGKPLTPKLESIFKIPAGAYSRGRGEAFGGAAMSKPKYKPKDDASGAFPTGLIGPTLYERVRAGLKFALFSVAVVALLLAAGWHYAFH